jgi:polyhydroxyalkanoate synthesis regulator phasin
LPEVVLEEKRREIIKEWIKEGKISLKGDLKG